MNRQKQKGVALAISLMLLTVITLISLSAMRSATLETRIAVNYQHKQLAFQAAENALSTLFSMRSTELQQLKVPGTIGAQESNPNWYQQNTSHGRAQADLDLTLLEVSPPGKYKFSGFGLGISTVLYQADAYGKVEGSKARVHNRMQIALIRQ